MGELYACPVSGTQKEQSAAAHAMLEQILPGYAAAHGITLPDPLRFSMKKNGKPYVADCPAVHFNLTHCKGLAVCLISPFSCGVDAEPKRPLREQVVKRVCAQSERTALAAAEDKDLLFTRLWTLKESYVKAIGVGISYPMKEIAFHLQGGSIRCSRSDAEFRQMLFEGFAVSVCILR